MYDSTGGEALLEQYFCVEPQLDIPIYRQLVDKIHAAVKMGDLIPGEKLPTVQELADQLSVAKGTVKRAYDELGNMGVLKKIQGRGTFVCYQPANSVSRKERAMGAIDVLLDQLEEMGFSASEINIFLTLKQRERSEAASTVRVAVLDCVPESLSQLTDRLRSIKGIELYSYLIETIQHYPYKLDEETDLVVTTAEHAEYLESILPDRNKLARVAMRLTADALTGMVRLHSGDHVGILTGSSQFGDMLYNACHSFSRNVTFSQPMQFGPELDVDAFLADKDAVLVPADYKRYCSEEICGALSRWEMKGRLIPCAYEIDEGSALYLEEKLQQLRQSKLI